MGKLISLTAYRDGIRLDGLTLVWRGLRHALTVADALKFAEALQEARCLVGVWGLSSGWLLESDGKTVTISGWDMGPARLTTADDIAKLTLDLARNARFFERDEAGTEGGWTA